MNRQILKIGLLTALLAGGAWAQGNAPDPQNAQAVPTSPLQLKVGDAYITPVGFMDFTTVFRTADAGTGIGTNFGSIPFNTTPTASLTELRESPQNSRIGARVDAMVKNAHVIGYWESDFLGNNPGNVAVTSNSDTFRLRLYWVDVRKDKWEILGGQSWSLITPGRNGISPLPSDIFYSLDMDVNYQAGLAWGRIPQFRVVYHPTDTVAAGLSLEEPEQYAGGSGGGGTITFPTNSSISTNYANQLNTGTQTFATPNVMPDVIGKLAFDPKTGSTSQHIEFVGLYREFKVYNPANFNKYSAPGAGVALNMNFALVKNFHLLTNNFYGDGGGRYLFGLAPDVVVRGDGSVAPIHDAATVSGFEATPGPTTNLFGYYGDVYIGRSVVIDGLGKLVGYGYTGSPNSQNRNIQEGTLGFIQTFWRNPTYGALQLIGQVSYINRDPWYVPAAGAPKSAHDVTVFLDLRYTLPGTPPKI
jgi:hypothetical protein